MASSSALGPRLEGYVAELVESGRYTSRDDVLREGVRLIEEREKMLAVLDAALARGVADADAGHVKPLETVRERLVTKYEAEANARGGSGSV